MDDQKLEIMNKTAERIRYFRTKRGLSQEALALSAGLAPAFLGHIERSLKCPTIDTLNRIAIALNISVSSLLDFDSEGKPSTRESAVERLLASVKNLSPNEIDQVTEIIEKIITFR
jgi:transcriptional regulator with XRE-family HTH domain